eukprot:TRINITY_DN648_c0_g1_i1.p1 TRINITY_DN648_c0_g1~~TRINITY_DN648_c0_g1_i1.p1  ORF type:complete len:304 (+),score=92.55 TRINITY_DN648_c0_g1_i1:564-1475(+)
MLATFSAAKSAAGIKLNDELYNTVIRQIYKSGDIAQATELAAEKKETLNSQENVGFSSENSIVEFTAATDLPKALQMKDELAKDGRVSWSTYSALIGWCIKNGDETQARSLLKEAHERFDELKRQKEGPGEHYDLIRKWREEKEQQTREVNNLKRLARKGITPTPEEEIISKPTPVPKGLPRLKKDQLMRPFSLTQAIFDPLIAFVKEKGVNTPIPLSDELKANMVVYEPHRIARGIAIEAMMAGDQAHIEILRTVFDQLGLPVRKIFGPFEKYVEKPPGQLHISKRNLRQIEAKKKKEAEGL